MTTVEAATGGPQGAHRLRAGCSAPELTWVQREWRRRRAGASCDALFTLGCSSRVLRFAEHPARHSHKPGKVNPGVEEHVTFKIHPASAFPSSQQKTRDLGALVRSWVLLYTALGRGGQLPSQRVEGRQSPPSSWLPSSSLGCPPGHPAAQVKHLPTVAVTLNSPDFEIPFPEAGGDSLNVQGHGDISPTLTPIIPPGLQAPSQSRALARAHLSVARCAET